MKTLNIVLKVILCLLISTPILGALGIFPPPTPDLYNTKEAFDFINVLSVNAAYISYLIAIVFAVSIILVVMNKMALVALLILPITVNIISFHAFLDGGLLTSGAIMANALILLNIYFLWQNRATYKSLWR